MKIGIVQVALSHGGAERVGVMLANGFQQHGHQVFILTDLNERIDYQVDDDVQILDFVGKNTNSFMKWIKAIKNIRKSMKIEKPDVLIGIMGLCTLVTYIASLGLHVPVVMTEHNSFERPESAPMSFSQRVFKFWINRLYKHITVLTEADKRIAERNGLRNIVVMPNPLSMKPAAVIPNKEKVILAAGRVDSWHAKGFDVLVKAWATLYEKYPNWNLQIAGLCDIKAHYERIPQIIEELDISERTKLLGYRQDVESLYKKSEIFVLSSRYEGFGLVLIEAMSQGCAPIACDYKGRQREIFEELKNERIEELKNGSVEVCENGILCEPDNVEALASAMEKMMEDESYRRKAQENAIERSRFYSIENTIERWEVYLNQIINTIS
jgi:glycosyltransferase involved in cell wall biosynthesis